MASADSDAARAHAQEKYFNSEMIVSMAFYGISLVPLMSKLNEVSEAVQCWLADDASCGGKVRDILKWWLLLKTVGPKFGYFPKATKCWLIVKPDKF